MNKLLILVLASILIIGTFGVVQDIYAPPDKPEKIKVDSISWNTESQSFVIDFRIHHGIAKAGQSADFSIQTKLIVDNGFEIFETTKIIPLGSVDLIVDETAKEAAGSVDITYFPNEIDIVDVTVDMEILNPSGKPVATAEPKTFEVEIIPPSVEVCDNGIDDDGDRLIDCSDADCTDNPVCEPLSCESDRDCPEESSCVFGICVDDNAPLPQFCEDDSDCPPALSCQFGICLPF